MQEIEAAKSWLNPQYDLSLMEAKSIIQNQNDGRLDTIYDAFLLRYSRGTRAVEEKTFGQKCPKHKAARKQRRNGKERKNNEEIHKRFPCCCQNI